MRTTNQGHPLLKPDRMAASFDPKRVRTLRHWWGAGTTSLPDLGWRANAISVFGAALSVLAGVVLACGFGLLSAGVLFALGGLCDMLDGHVARQCTSRNARAGAFLDSV